MDFDEIYLRGQGWYKEQSIRFWKSSVECRPSPAPNTIISVDEIFVKIDQRSL